ncbi:MAG: hypothetical protein ABJN36_08835 [Cyclobacteriaceae bacterium]
MNRQDGIFVALAIVLGSVFYILGNYNGLGMTYDSHLYVKIAEQLTKGDLLNAEGLHIKPPLYPLLVFCFGKSALLYLNFVALFLNFVLLILISKSIQSTLIRSLCLAILVFFTPTYLVHSFMWTESYFMLCLFGSFYTFLLYEKSGLNAWLYISIMLMLVLPFIRFAGIFIWLPVFIVCFARGTRKAKITIAAISLCFLAIGMAWALSFEEGFLARWAQWTSPFRNMDFSIYTDNFRSFLEGLSMILLPQKSPYILRMMLSLLTIGILIFSSIRFFARDVKKEFWKSIPFIFITYYFLLHTVFRIEYYSAERYLSPVYPLLIIAVFYFLDQKKAFLNLWSKRAIFLMIAWLILYSAARTTKNVLFWNEVRQFSNPVSRNLP